MKHRCYFFMKSNDILVVKRFVVLILQSGRQGDFLHTERNYRGIDVFKGELSLFTNVNIYL